MAKIIKESVFSLVGEDGQKTELRRIQEDLGSLNEETCSPEYWEGTLAGIKDGSITELTTESASKFLSEWVAARASKGENKTNKTA